MLREAPETREAKAAPAAQEVQEALEAPAAQEVQEAKEAQEAQEAPAAPAAPEALEVQEANEAQAATEAPEVTEAPEGSSCSRLLTVAHSTALHQCSAKSTRSATSMGVPVSRFAATRLRAACSMVGCFARCALSAPLEPNPLVGQAMHSYL